MKPKFKLFSATIAILSVSFVIYPIIRVLIALPSKNVECFSFDFGDHSCSKLEFVFDVSAMNFIFVTLPIITLLAVVWIIGFILTRNVAR